eukprot:TRINITY_DN20834_c0_g1_i1.p1 TRINITY_DN20834_c0_g1~~TRINITY_DN20834_c0_g1_i1.p1  ORF type:complete len:190 (+),score=46.23 TRINITY_DN20834_c0_g1_i1:385-954(+)
MSASKNEASADSHLGSTTTPASGYEYLTESAKGAEFARPLSKNLSTPPPVPMRNSFDAQEKATSKDNSALRESVIMEAPDPDSLPSFVKHVSRRDADALLADEDLGAFLVRVSDNHRLVISMKVPGSKGPRVSHFRLGHGEHKGYKLQDTFVGTHDLSDLTSKLMQDGCKAVTEQPFLKRIDPPAHFQA